MLRSRFWCLLVLISPLAAACSTADYYRVTVRPQGQVVATVEHVVDGVATVVDERMAAQDANVVVQTVKPYVTYDGPWGGSDPSTAPGTILVRTTVSRGPTASALRLCPQESADFGAGPALSDPRCEVPSLAPAAVAAPLPTCIPYVGCDGTVGGNRPTPGPTYKPMPPCEPGRAPGLADLPPPPSAKQVGLAVVGLPVHLVTCLFGFVQCLLGIP